MFNVPLPSCSCQSQRRSIQKAKVSTYIGLRIQPFRCFFSVVLSSEYLRVWFLPPHFPLSRTHTHTHTACNVPQSTQSRRRHYKTTRPMASPMASPMARPMAISIHKICCPPTHHHFLSLCLISSSKPDTTVCCQATYCTC